MLLLSLCLSTIGSAQLPSAPERPPIFPGRLFPTDLGNLHYGVADVASADMDQDGHVDALLLRMGPTAVSLLRGDGRGNLRCTSTLGVAPGEDGYDGNIAVLDVDGDGHLDAVTSGSSLGVLHVFHGDGAGSLNSSAIVQLSGVAGELEAVDMDRDGLLDLVVQVQSGLSILLRQPTGGFASEVHYDSPHNLLAVGDLDSDLYPDVVTANVEGEVWRFLNAGDGSLLPHDKVPGTLATRGLALSDLDGDGRLDLVRGKILGVNESQLCVHLGDGAGQFAQPLERRIGNGELIGAGQLAPGQEVALVREWGFAGSVALVGSRLTEPAPFLPSYHSYAFALADLDEDGASDWITGVVQEDLHAAATVFVGGGDGTLEGIVMSPSTVGAGAEAFLDLDADGHLDAVGVDQLKQVLFVHLGLPGGRFLPASVTRIDTYESRYLPGDFDGDGLLDLALVTPPMSSISFMRGDGTGGLGPIATLFTALPWPPSGGPPIAGDVDGDGNDEAILSVPMMGAMAVFGVVDGRFRLEELLAAPGAIGPMFARDRAGSTAPDIVYLRAGPSVTCELWGLAVDSTGTWQSPFPWMKLPIPWIPGVSTSYRVPWTAFLDLCDVDEDRLLDVVAYRWVGQAIWPSVGAAGTQLGLWRGVPGGSWIESDVSRLDGSSDGPGPMDLDGDGAVELVLRQSNSQGVLYGSALVVRRLDHGQIVGEPDRYSFYATPVGDVNGDGYPDAVHATYGALVTFLNQTGASR
jgi:hypothetical protein